MISQRFAQLTVTAESGSIKGRKMYLCRCDCGKETSVSGSNLRSGRTRSCGCLFRKGNNTRHGQLRSLTYMSYQAMRARCNNPKHMNYHNYGGRGITVCDRWSDFRNFLADMGERPNKGMTLDRKDPNKGYCKENCRWATRKEQNDPANRRPVKENLPF